MTLQNLINKQFVPLAMLVTDFSLFNRSSTLRELRVTLCVGEITSELDEEDNCLETVVEVTLLSVSLKNMFKVLLKLLN